MPAKKKAPKKKTAPKKMGRPTKCTDELADKLVEYFENSETLPFFSEFEKNNNLSIGVCSKWAQNKEKYPKFFQAYKQAKHLQEKHLVVNALDGTYNSTFAIFTAKNILGWRDKKEIETDIRTKGINFTMNIGDEDNG